MSKGFTIHSGDLQDGICTIHIELFAWLTQNLKGGNHYLVIEDITALQFVLPKFAGLISPAGVVASRSIRNGLTGSPTKTDFALPRALEDGHVFSRNRFDTDICSMSSEQTKQPGIDIIHAEAM